MAEATGQGRTATGITVTVRFFAAARDAAGTDEEDIRIPTGTTLADLTVALAARDGQLGRVLQKCSYLCDGVAVRNLHVDLESRQTIDVLPPFAGG